MVNLVIITTVVVSVVAITSLGYFLYPWQNPGLDYGSADELLIPKEEMKQLTRSFNADGGAIKYPTSWYYDFYATPFNGKCIERPYVVFLPGSDKNVQDALMLFKTYNQEFKIRGGGHDFECNSVST